MLSISDLHKKYGNHVALDGVSFNAEKGHIYGFIGPNGAGKSTTLKIIAGVLSYDTGSVLINGHDVVSEPEKAKASLGYLPEVPPLYPDMTVYEYLEFIAIAKLVPKISVKASVMSVMEKTNTALFADKLIGNLSKGMAQRVGIAGALLAEPDVLILDEPTVGLDPEQIANIRELISSLKEDRVVLVSSHILSEIEEICDRIFIINKGRIICDDSTEHLIATSKADTIINMCVKASEIKINEILLKVDKIASAQITACHNKPGFANISIRVKGNTDIRERLYFAFSGASCPIIELCEQKPSLENLYREFIKNDDASRIVTDKKNTSTKKVSILKNLFSQSIYQKNDDETKKSDDADSGDSYRPLFR